MSKVRGAAQSDLAIEDLASTSALMKEAGCGWTGNSFTVQGHHNCFAFLFPYFKDDKIRISGGITWGKNGLNFVAKINGGQVLYTIQDHVEELTQIERDKIVDTLLSKAKKRLIEKISKATAAERWDMNSYQGPMLKAIKYETSLSKRTLENIDYYLSTNTFDKKFCELLKQKGSGIQCNRHLKK